MYKRVVHKGVPPVGLTPKRVKRVGQLLQVPINPPLPDSLLSSVCTNQKLKKVKVDGEVAVIALPTLPC